MNKIQGGKRHPAYQCIRVMCNAAAKDVRGTLCTVVPRSLILVLVLVLALIAAVSHRARLVLTCVGRAVPLRLT